MNFERCRWQIVPFPNDILCVGSELWEVKVGDLEGIEVERLEYLEVEAVRSVFMVE